MASFVMRDSKGTIVPEDQSTYINSPHMMAQLGPENPQLSPGRVNSPEDYDFLPNTRRSDSQSQLHPHPQQFYVTSADDQLTGWHHGSSASSASQVKLWLQPSRSRESVSSDVHYAHRYTPYFNPSSIKHLTLPKTSHLDLFCDKPSKLRKRTIILKPKCPKYQGLSNFAAPLDLVSEIVAETNNNNNNEKSSSPSLKSVSSLNTDSTNTDTYPTEESSQTTVEFLKYLDFEEWDQRKQDLSQMLEERKNIFLKNGFAQTSGKPFKPDEQSIEKKPVPNRWVWYMHISTEYDKLKNTRVPPGGPAGYLKYGWDRLGPAGKQPYQELADIYSAQRVKYMAALGITEENPRKKPRPSEKRKAQCRSTQELMIRADQSPNGFTNESIRPGGKVINQSTKGEISNQRSNYHIDMPIAQIQSFVHCNLLYQQINPCINEEKTWDCSSGRGETFEMSEAASYPSYLRSPVISSDYSQYYNEHSYSPPLCSDSIRNQVTPLGFPSPQNEYSLCCNPSSIFPRQGPSGFQSSYDLSPESITSSHSEFSAVSQWSTPCIDNSSALPSKVSSLPSSNLFGETFSQQESDCAALDPININC